VKVIVGIALNNITSRVHLVGQTLNASTKSTQCTLSAKVASQKEETKKVENMEEEEFPKWLFKKTSCAKPSCAH